MNFSSFDSCRKQIVGIFDRFLDNLILQTGLTELYLRLYLLYLYIFSYHIMVNKDSKIGMV